MMRITSIQLQAVDRPKGQTIEQVLSLIEQARGSDLVLLPEIWPTGYFRFDAYGEEAEPLDGPLVTAMGQASKAIGAWLFMGSLVERSASGLHNTSVLIRPDGQVACTYRKIHLFGHQSRERELLTAGHGVTVTQTPWGRVGLSTCYDLRFPELYRRMVDAGAEMFLVASAWPAARREAWRLFNQARAHENLAFLLSCNGCGTSGGALLGGHSMFVDPWGEIVAEAGEDPCLLTAEIDPATAADARGRFSALDDRVFST